MIQYSIFDVRVLSGDTFDCMIDLGFNVVTRQRVRLYNVNAPDVRSRDANHKRCGKLAKQQLIRWVNESSELFLQCDSKREKFGRVLGELIAVDAEGNKVDVNKWLCENSYAVAYTGQSQEAIEAQHLVNFAKFSKSETQKDAGAAC